MHKILSIVLLLTLGFAAEIVTFDNNWAENPLFNVLSETPAGVEIIFSMHRLVIEETLINGVLMKTYGMPGIFLPNDEGAPNLAGAGRYIAIPQGAHATVTILGSRTEVHHNIEVAPAPNIPLETDKSPLRYEKDMKIYSRDAYYPEVPVRLSEPMKIRGVDVVILGITPFQYNPVTKELIIYKDLRVRVDFVGGNGHFGEDRLRSRFWEPILQAHLLNYNSLPKIDFYNSARTQARYGYEYVIIVPDDPVFEAWGDTIKTWRKLQGISTEVFTLTEVGGSSSTDIENFLNDAYNNWDIPPVAFLLLSDYPSSGEIYGITSPRWNYYCVSDNIYADVDGNNLPDMHHARICAQGEDDLNIMINKFLSYERDPYTVTDFYDEPLVACGWQNDRWFQLCAEVIRGFFINVLGKNPARQYNLGSPATPVPGGPWSTNSNTPMIVAYFGSAGLGYVPDTNPYDADWWNNGSGTGVNTAINSGAFVVQHRDHGSETGWDEPYYQNEHLDGLNNDMFTFVYSINCLTGKYDWYNECFAEKFHRIEYGALGLNGASETSYSFVNDTYVWGMYDGLWPEFMPDYPSTEMTGYNNLRPCMAMTYGKYFLQQSNWPSNSGSKTVTYHLFHHHSDAFVTLYSEMPQELSVSHASTLLGGVTSFTVVANDGSVIALTVNNEIIGVAEGTGSPVVISIPPQVPGNTMKVTVTKANYYRYEADVSIISNTYPYVILISDIIDDATGGNGDGVVNPGETVEYGVWAENVGAGTVQDVYGILAVSDSFVTLTVDSSWYGNIAQDDSSLSDPYYSFTVVNNCPDNQTLNLTLEFHDINDTTWTSYSTITVYSPDLTYQDVVVVNDNNGNGTLEPGEDADLVVTIKNEGSITANNVTSTLITASPYITINDASGNFGSIAPGNTANNSADPYNVTASSSTPYGCEVDFSIIVQADLYVDTLNFILFAGLSVPSDTGHYYVYYSGGPHLHSPVFEWIAIDTTQSTNPGTSLDLIDNQTITVNLPFIFKYYGLNYDQISICSNGWIAMGSQADVDWINSSIPNANGPQAMVAGLWDDLDPGNISQPSNVYYYNDEANHRFIVEYFQVEHFPSGDHETFEIILLDPEYYSTPTGDGEIIVQYLLGMQQGDNTLGIENPSETVGIEYYFNEGYHPLAVSVTDSFALKYTTHSPGTGIEEHEDSSTVPIRTILNAAYPNPFTDKIEISYSIGPGAKGIELKIYDATGRLVKSFNQLTNNQSLINQIVWDGKDDFGRAVSSGVYFVRLVAGDYKEVEKAVLLR